MSDIDDTILDAAIGWHIRQETMDERGWSDFVAWLEADPAHTRAYDAVSMADAERLAPVIADRPRAANDDEGFVARRQNMRRRGFAIAAAALAAAVVGSVGVMDLRRGAAAPQIEVAGNMPRSMVLTDGTRVVMAPGAEIAVDGEGPRSVAVRSGRVTFRVTHDARHPFTVRAGDWEFQDVGTVFAVTRGERGVDVSVSEGSVLFDPQNNRIALRAGEALSVLPNQRVMRSQVDSNQARTLVFAGQPVQFAAETIGLVLGRDVRADDEVAQAPFTGIVRLTGDAPRDMAHFAELTGMRVSHDGDGWIIAPPSGSMR